MTTLGPKFPTNPSGAPRESVTLAGSQDGVPMGNITASGFWMVQRVVDTWMPIYPDLVTAAQDNPYEYLYSAGELPEPFEEGRTYGRGMSMIATAMDHDHAPGDPGYVTYPESIWVCVTTHDAGTWEDEQPTHNPGYCAPGDLWMNYDSMTEPFSGAPNPKLDQIVPTDYVTRRDNGFLLTDLQDWTAVPLTTKGVQTEYLVPGYFYFVTGTGGIDGIVDPRWPPDSIYGEFFFNGTGVQVWGVPYTKNPTWVQGS